MVKILSKRQYSTAVATIITSPFPLFFINVFSTCFKQRVIVYNSFSAGKIYCIEKNYVCFKSVVRIITFRLGSELLH